MTTKALDALMFVDTNILLDFYRNRKSDIRLQYLNQLEKCKDRLILGSQIEMEFKKNRQRAIVDSLNNFSSPDWNKLTTPVVLADSKASGMIDGYKKSIIAQQKKISLRIERILAKPSADDPVYKTLQRLFKHNSKYNLDRQNKERFSIRNLARKRFVLGYPPRKDGDTSIGDAINWEWIIKCAKDSDKHIVIVTRDTDYGVVYGQHSHLNDWLKQEFGERVSKKRRIILTDKLSVGLRIIHASVTKEMEEEEARFLASNARNKANVEPLLPDPFS